MTNCHVGLFMGLFYTHVSSKDGFAFCWAGKPISLQENEQLKICPNTHSPSCKLQINKAAQQRNWSVGKVGFSIISTSRNASLIQQQKAAQSDVTLAIHLVL